MAKERKRSPNINDLIKRIKSLEEACKKKHESHRSRSTRSRSPHSVRSKRGYRSRSRGSRIDKDRERGRRTRKSRTARTSRHSRSSSASSRWPPSVEHWRDNVSSVQRHSDVSMPDLIAEGRNQSVTNFEQNLNQENIDPADQVDIDIVEIHSHRDEGPNQGVMTPNNNNNNAENGGTPLLIINNEEDLGEEVLQILGEDPQITNKENVCLHAAVCTRWAHILSHNIKEEDRKDLYERYKTPKNLETLEPPEINPEILPHLSSYHKSRDGGYFALQEHLAHSLTALGTSLNVLLTEGENIPKPIREKM